MGQDLRIFHTMSRVPPQASVVPSGLNATECTTAFVPVGSVAARVRVATSHSVIVPSLLPLARVVPSGLNAAACREPKDSR